MKLNFLRYRSPLQTISCALGALLLGLSVASAETLENLEKTFDAKPGGQLVLDVDFGSIAVATHAADQISIQVTRRITRGKKADEEAFLRDRPVTITQDGDTVTVRSKATTQGAWSWKGRQQISGKYVITVPAKFHVRLKTAGGAIEVKDVEGHVTLDTSGGDLRVQGGGGSLEGHTSGGSVAVKSFQGPVQVNTSGGSVRLDEVTGAVDGSTSGGSVSASLTSVAESVKLSTSGGAVTLRVPSGAAFDLDASTSGGSVGCDLPVTVTGKRSGSRLKGPVNGGGKPVVLRSSGGDVWVKTL